MLVEKKKQEKEMFKSVIASMIILSFATSAFASDEVETDAFVQTYSHTTLIEKDEDGLPVEISSDVTFVRVDGLPVEIIRK